jgi:hypothetical protein
MPAAQYREGRADRGPPGGDRLSRIRAGEALTAVGAVGLFVLLFADWFEGGGAARSGWSSLGWALVVLLVAELLVAITMVVATVARAKPAIIVGAAVITVVLGAVTFLVALIRVLITQPDLDLGLGNGDVAVQLAGYLGLLALALTAAGAWVTLADERTGAPESAYTPPPARPLPGA